MSKENNIAGVIKIQGTVVGGNKIGRTLGFPTANIRMDEHSEIADGVYAARTEVDANSYYGMVNIGYRPTVGRLRNQKTRERLLEITLFDFEGDLYGKELEIELIKHIRQERVFDSLEQLRECVDQDRVKIIEYLRSLK